jgi:hypothetical protein
VQSGTPSQEVPLGTKLSESQLTRESQHGLIKRKGIQPTSIEASHNP